MSNYKTFKLKELVDIRYGKDHKHLSEGDIPVYGSGGIMRFASDFLYDKESILIPRKGTLTNLFYIDKPFWSVDTMFYTQIKDIVFPKYLYYYLKGQNLASLNVGSAVPSLTTEVLNKFSVTIPEDIATQKEIAQILSSLDDKIELNLQMNQTLEAMAQAIFKEWFVAFNFPGFDGELVDGLPKGWVVKNIGELGTVITGTTPSSKKPELFGDITPFITPTDFKNYGKLILDANRYLSEQGRQSMTSRLLPSNSVLVTCIGSDMGKVAINRVESVSNQQINSIIPDTKQITYDYLYYDLVFKYNYLRNIATGGSTMPIINKSRFQEIEIIIPSEDLRNKFQELMNNFNFRIEENERQIKSLTQTRDTLLPKLMNGQLEVV